MTGFRTRLAGQRGEKVAVEHGFDRLPVDPFAIAEAHDLPVVAKPMEVEGVSGGIVLGPGDPFIFYATNIRSPGFQRFTVAHELGHALLDGHWEVLEKEGPMHVSRAGFCQADAGTPPSSDARHLRTDAPPGAVARGGLAHGPRGSAAEPPPGAASGSQSAPGAVCWPRRPSRSALMTREPHPAIHGLLRRHREGGIDRREFLRTATLLGLSAGAAYAAAGLPGPARAQEAMPRGGTLRWENTIYDVSSPATANTTAHPLVYASVVEHLARTGPDNVIRPHLLEGWEPSEDLRTWTLRLRPGVTWHSGRAFTADDVAWNLTRLVADETGSSVLGLMKPYLLEEEETGETGEDGAPLIRHRLWREDAIERVDEATVRLNLATPQLAVPEHLFH